MTNPKWKNTLLMLVIILAIIASMANGRRRKNKNRKRNSMLKDALADVSDSKSFVIIDGDIFFGTLMQIHDGGVNGVCGNLSHSALLELEALLYTVDMVNIHTSLLPGIKLGIYVRDSCADPDHTLKQALTLMEGRFSESPRWSYRCPDGKIAESVLPTITGIITSIDSPAANVQAASLLQLFRLPQINAKSRSPLVRTVGRFPYLHHSVPSYFQQLTIVIELLRYLQWSYIHVIFEDSEYGSWLNYKLQEILQRSGICVATNMRIQPYNRKGNKQIYDVIASRLLLHPYARGVMIVTQSDRVVARILAAVKRKGGTRRLAFLGLGWGKRIRTPDIERELEGTLVMQLTTNKVASLIDYINQLKPSENERNPWFSQFWEEVFDCNMPPVNHGNTSMPNTISKLPQCSGKEDISHRVASMGTDSEHISNAFMAFSQTLHNIHWDLCHGVAGLCDAMKSITGEYLSRYLERVRFKSLSGQEFVFHSQREPRAQYRLMSFQQISYGQYKWVNLGVSRTRFSNATLASIKFRRQEPTFPPSFCSLPCEPGHVKTMMDDERCCWLCAPCPENHYLPIETQCEACPDGTTPNFDRRACIPSLSANRKSTSAAKRRQPTNSTAEKVEQSAKRVKLQTDLMLEKRKKQSNTTTTKKQQSLNRGSQRKSSLNTTTDGSKQENSTTKINKTDMTSSPEKNTQKPVELDVKAKPGISEEKKGKQTTESPKAKQIKNSAKDKEVKLTGIQKEKQIKSSAKEQKGKMMGSHKQKSLKNSAKDEKGKLTEIQKQKHLKNSTIEKDQGTEKPSVAPRKKQQNKLASEEKVKNANSSLSHITMRTRTTGLPLKADITKSARNHLGILTTTTAATTTADITTTTTPTAVTTTTTTTSINTNTKITPAKSTLNSNIKGLKTGVNFTDTT